MQGVTETTQISTAVQTYTVTAAVSRLTAVDVSDVGRLERFQDYLDTSGIVEGAACTLDNETVSFTGQIDCACGVVRAMQLATYALIFGSIEAIGAYPDPRGVTVTIEDVD